MTTQSAPSIPSDKTPEPPFLHMRQVSVAPGDRVILENINLTILAGEHVVILGPNGCGKSTLIRTMNCELYPVQPPAGDLADATQPRPEVLIFGRPRWDLTELRKHFGIVSESLALQANNRGESGLLPRTTGLESVIAGFFSATSLWPNLHVTEEMRTRANEALERVQATRLAHQAVSTMSSGEKRRILIARALVHRPRQILLDEPSNALDLAAQRTLRETMRTLMQPDETGHSTGLILVTHHLADIPPEIDRVILMKEGRILADGPRTELLTEPILSDLFNTKVNLGQQEGWLHSW